MFELTVEQTFAAGHALRHYKGKCENVHGHNYRVQVVLQGPELNSIGLLVDFVEVKRVMREIIEYLDHKFLNDVPPFDVLNPSAENMARYFYEEMEKGLKRAVGQDGVAPVPVSVASVEIWETDTSSCTYHR